MVHHHAFGRLCCASRLVPVGMKSPPGRIVQVVAPFGPLALLFAVYTVAILVGAVISNNAVVVLMFPIVVRVCEGGGHLPSL